MRKRGLGDRELLDHIFSRCFRREETGCLEWQGAADPDGYGRVYYRGSVWVAPRLVLHLLGKPLSTATRHRCDNPRCVEPAHLEPGTISQNNQDCASRGRHVGCRLGGSLNPAAKLDEAAVRSIRADTRPRQVVAQAHDITATSVSMIQRRQTWRSLPD